MLRVSCVVISVLGWFVGGVLLVAWRWFALLRRLATRGGPGYIIRVNCLFTIVLAAITSANCLGRTE